MHTKWCTYTHTQVCTQTNTHTYVLSTVSYIYIQAVTLQVLFFYNLTEHRFLFKPISFERELLVYWLYQIKMRGRQGFYRVIAFQTHILQISCKIWPWNLTLKMRSELNEIYFQRRHISGDVSHKIWISNIYTISKYSLIWGFGGLFEF